MNQKSVSAQVDKLSNWDQAVLLSTNTISSGSNSSHFFGAVPFAGSNWDLWMMMGSDFLTTKGPRDTFKRT